jgi:hypothetical protein
MKTLVVVCLLKALNVKMSMAPLIVLGISNYEDVGVISLLVASNIALGSVVVFLYKSKEKALLEKDVRIREVIKDHQNDLKEYATDMKGLAGKYHQFTQTLKDMVSGK